MSSFLHFLFIFVGGEVFPGGVCIFQVVLDFCVVVVFPPFCSGFVFVAVSCSCAVCIVCSGCSIGYIKHRV